jgi:predicted MFS family arabinose efflux permease
MTPPAGHTPRASADRTGALLLLFSGVNLVIGTSAFMSAGLLEPMAESLGTSVAAVGQATAVYAVATAVLAPVVLTLTGRMSRRGALALVFALFTLGNALTALAPDLPTLLAARVLMGAGSATTALMAGLTVGLVPADKRARALSIVFLGISLSYVTGVPLGAWVGLGWGWRVPAWAATALCALATFALWRTVPGERNPGAPSPLAGAGRLLRDARLWAVYGLTFTYFVAIFIVFSYVGPMLQELVEVGRTGLSALISVFGVAGVVGTLLGGRLADRLGPRRTLLGGLALLAASLALLPLTRGHLAALLPVVMVWGAAGFSLMAPQQLRLAKLAGAQTPLALSLNSSVLYLGTAAGAAVGGAALAHVAPSQLPWVAAPVVMLAWAVAAATTPSHAPHAPHDRHDRRD